MVISATVNINRDANFFYRQDIIYLKPTRQSDSMRKIKPGIGLLNIAYDRVKLPAS
jgi:hypothetical protein